MAQTSLDSDAVKRWSEVLMREAVSHPVMARLLPLSPPRHLTVKERAVRRINDVRYRLASLIAGFDVTDRY